jgi:hypothetical protein
VDWDNSQYRNLLWAGWFGDQTLVGARFSIPFQKGPGAHAESRTMAAGSFLGVKWLEHGIDTSLPSRTEVKEREELYLFSLSAFMACYRVNFTLLYFTLFIFKFALMEVFFQTELESSEVLRK